MCFISYGLIIEIFPISNFYKIWKLIQYEHVGITLQEIAVEPIFSQIVIINPHENLHISPPWLARYLNNVYYSITHKIL